MGHHILRRITNLTFAFLLAVFSVNLSGVLSLQNAYANHNSGGNNGTLKVHEKGDTVGHEDNDPKVCKFNFEGFGFDNGQTGYIKVETQPGGVDSLSPSLYPFGPANNSGNWTSGAYINDGGTYTLPNGQYKATLYGKDTGNPSLPDLSDDKAKSKVFKVNCPTPVTPTAPTLSDICGSSNDTYTIPNIPGVQYQIQKWFFGYYWDDIDPDTYDGSGTVKIRAIAEDDYQINGTSEWTLTFSNSSCTVTPAVPTKNDVCGTANDTYTIPTTAGVKYQIKVGNSWVDKAAGSYTSVGVVEIRAVALSGYELAGNDNQYKWTFNFTNVACVIPVSAQPAISADETCGTANDTYTIPNVNGVQYYVNGIATAPGTYNTNGALSVTITAAAKAGFVLISDNNSWTLTFTNKSCVTPAEPSNVDLCGKPGDKYTIPTTTGVIYKVNGVTKAAGTYQTNNDVVITAVAANSNYVLTGTTSWTLDFSQDSCPVTPAVPTMQDECGASNDYYTIPTTEHVTYKIKDLFHWSWTTQNAGSNWGFGTVKVKAFADSGYEITGTNEWTFNFDSDKCEVTTPDVTFVDVCGSVNDTFTIPAAPEHITYKKVNFIYVLGFPIPVGLSSISEGQHAGSGLVKIVAVADEGYEIDGDWYWIHKFDSNKCDIGEVEGDPTFNDVCGTANDTYTIVAAPGVTYKVNGVDGPESQPGTHPGAGSVVITAEATDPNDVITGVTEWSHTFTNEDCPVEPCVPSVVTLNMLNNLQSNDNCEPGRGNAGGPTPTELPQTGANTNPLQQLLTVIVAGIIAYGATYFLVNRRELSRK